MSSVAVTGTSYCLNHCNNFSFYYGNTPYMERKTNNTSVFLENLPKFKQTYNDACSYAPNLVYIGAMDLKELSEKEAPMYKHLEKSPLRFGSFGEIMPEDEFLGLIDICDVFDLVWLNEQFVQNIKVKLEKHPLLTESQLKRLKKGHSQEEIEKEISQHHALALYYEDKVVGCVRQGHETDENLTAHVLMENLACKASGVLSLLHLIKNSNIEAKDIDYVIECSEEAVGDMNQRGGGNMAKALAEIADCVNASGCDIRGFCAGPVSAVISASGLVSSGIYKNVAVIAGGSIPKLYMNAREHVKKEMPALENCIGSFGVLIGEDDGTQPIIRLDSVGKHSVGTGASPQAVTTALVFDPLTKLGLKITDVDKYAPELHTAEITVPAGAGDVPQANYKMIAALAVMKEQIERADMNNFVEKIGMMGFAPTQGHIPSGVPYIGHAIKALQNNEIHRAMIIGKGSLFLGRITNLTDGVSFLLENSKKKEISSEKSISKSDIKEMLLEVLDEISDNLADTNSTKLQS